MRNKKGKKSVAYAPRPGQQTL